jgi:Xaa-Pro aminopeptidase
MNHETYLERRDRVRAIASERGHDATLVISRAADRAGDVEYLCGHVPFLSGHVSRFTVRGRGYGALLLPTDTSKPDRLLVTTPFYRPPVAIEHVEINPNFPAGLADLISQAGLERAQIGLAGFDVLTAGLYHDLLRYRPQADFREADDVVSGLRAVKSAAEIEIIERGALIADEVAELVRNAIRPGVAENEIARLITSELAKRGVDMPFATCQSGVERSGEPFTLPAASDRVMQDNDLVHMEINGKLEGYKIDICRSTVVGKSTPDRIHLLETALLMFEETVKATRPGVPAQDLERLAARIAADAGFTNNFAHAHGGPGTYLGHGIGLGIDEPPILGEGDLTQLAAGMVLTIEPGLYRTPAGGARIEDEVLVTEDGARILNRSERRWWV